MVKKIHNFTRDKKIEPKSLFEKAYQTISELETPLGINASSLDERYAAFFGRDSMITCLKLLRVFKVKPDSLYLKITEKTIKTSIRLQGREINIRSGEKPGKIIHEYRESGYYHLINKPNPWYIYPDKTLRNYDTTDSTLLFLILVAEYFEITNDQVFLSNTLPAVEKAFFWAKKYGHKGGNKFFIEYQLQRPPGMGGLVNQGWMDSKDSLSVFGKPPKKPIALVETQGYYFKALRLWSKILKNSDNKKSLEFKETARKLKYHFNKSFSMKVENLSYYSYAIYGQKAYFLTIRSNPGHCLWSSVKNGNKYESIIEYQRIEEVVETLMKPDIFVPGAGIRTLSSKSKFYNICGYHNGSIWPFDNGLISEGFENFGYKKEAQMVKEAVLSAISYFGTPIELYCAKENGSLQEYKEGDTHGTHKQAWTAATILDFTKDYVV